MELLQTLENKRRITNASKTRFRLRHRHRLGCGFSERGRRGPSAYPAWITYQPWTTPPALPFYSSMFSPTSTYSVPPTYVLAVSPTVAPSNSISTFDQMDLDGIQWGKIFKGQVLYKVKIARQLAGVCSYCGLEGYDQKTCVKFVCFNCGKVGHRASHCDQPKH